MDEGDGVALMDPDFPEDMLPEKTANVVQVVAQSYWNFLINAAEAVICYCNI